jgi:hypothetical protein
MKACPQKTSPNAAGTIPRTEELAAVGSRMKAGMKKRGQQQQNSPTTKGRSRLFRECWSEEEWNRVSIIYELYQRQDYIVPGCLLI